MSCNFLKLLADGNVNITQSNLWDSIQRIPESTQLSLEVKTIYNFNIEPRVRQQIRIPDHDNCMLYILIYYEILHFNLIDSRNLPYVKITRHSSWIPRRLEYQNWWNLIVGTGFYQSTRLVGLETPTYDNYTNSENSLPSNSAAYVDPSTSDCVPSWSSCWSCKGTLDERLQAWIISSPTKLY